MGKKWIKQRLAYLSIHGIPDPASQPVVIGMSLGEIARQSHLAHTDIPSKRSSGEGNAGIYRKKTPEKS